MVKPDLCSIIMRQIRPPRSVKRLSTRLSIRNYSAAWPKTAVTSRPITRSIASPASSCTILAQSLPNQMSEIVNPAQKSAYDSPWSGSNRLLRVLWEFCWFVFCVWTPKPLNPWRLFWLRVFDARIEGTPFVHQRARIAVPWNLILHDRACLGDRTNVYNLGEVEIGARATIAQEAYLDTASHDFTGAEMQLSAAKITICDDA